MNRGSVRIALQAPRERYTREIVFHFQDLVGMSIPLSEVKWFELVLASLMNANNSMWLVLQCRSVVRLGSSWEPASSVSLKYSISYWNGCLCSSASETQHQHHPRSNRYVASLRKHHVLQSQSLIVQYLRFRFQPRKVLYCQCHHTRSVAFCS